MQIEKLHRILTIFIFISIFLNHNIHSAIKRRIDADHFTTIGLRSNGTVIVAGANAHGQANVRGWRNITQVACGPFHTLGLKSDRTVVATGFTTWGACNVNGWRGIVQIEGSMHFSIGVMSNGKVVATGYAQHGQLDVGDWHSIVQVDASFFHTVGLQSTGQVVATGLNTNGQCNVEGWHGITQVAAGSNHSVGLKSNGTVVTVGSNFRGACEVSGWRDIIQIAAGQYFTLGLKSDGTIVAVGDNPTGHFSEKSWNNIVQIAAGPLTKAGLKSDGSVIAAGRNNEGQCDVGLWNLDRGSNQVYIITIDGLSFWNTFLAPLPGFMPIDYSDYYLETAIKKAANEIGFSADDVTVIPFPWSRDAGDTEDVVNSAVYENGIPIGLREFLKYYHDKANSESKKFIIVSHSWGTVLAYLALASQSDQVSEGQRIYVDMLITLGSPLGTDNAHEGRYFEEEKIAKYVEDWMEVFGFEDSGRPIPLVQKWINFWVWGDPISGPMNGFMPFLGRADWQDKLHGIIIESSAYRNFGTLPPSHKYLSLQPPSKVTDFDNTKIINQIKEYLIMEITGSKVKDDLIGSWEHQGVYSKSSDTQEWIFKASPASKIAIGDLDGDGIDDLIGIWSSQGGVWIFSSSTEQWTLLSSTADWVSSGDMNGDGRIDLLGSWFGQGVFYLDSVRGIWHLLATAASQVTAGDLDGDGIDDLVGIWPGQGGVWAKYSKNQFWSLISSSADWINTGDMNGDGRVDLFGSCSGQGVFYLDSLTLDWTHMGTPAVQVSSGDFDGNWYDDLIGMWPGQGGVWARYFPSGTWDLMASTAESIDAGKLRQVTTLANNQSRPIMRSHQVNFTGKFPDRKSQYIDKRKYGPGGISFKYLRSKYIRPGQMIDWEIQEKIKLMIHREIKKSK